MCRRIFCEGWIYFFKPSFILAQTLVKMHQPLPVFSPRHGLGEISTQQVETSPLSWVLAVGIIVKYLYLKGRLFPEISRLLGLTADAPSLPTPLQGALIPARQGRTDGYFTTDGLLTSPRMDKVKSPNLIKRRINYR
jgi:hypothetical protein